MPEPLQILCIHGVNTPENDTSWKKIWTDVLRRRLTSFAPQLRMKEPEYLAYNDIFDQNSFGPIDTVQAVLKLTASGIWYGIGDALAGRRGLERGLSSTVRWTAGMIVQWAENMRLRDQTRRAFAARIRAVQPQVILAHSLGSLVLYDTLRLDPTLAENRALVTFGSQIGNPFVRGQLGGRIESVHQKFWWHIFNPHDRVFTHRLDIHNAPFEQVVIDVDKDFLDHDARNYLDDDLVAAHVWQPIAEGGTGRGLAAPAIRSLNEQRKLRVAHRALLVGINEYPDPQMRLEGCVNDTFLMSSTLQKIGFPSTGIRVLLDDRATTEAIWERLKWLVEGAEPGDQRIFFYSGHGAQIPDYGARDEVDHLDECLVPWDFDWSVDRSIQDDRLRELYAQLPYDTRLTMVLDCCHSGGMTRGSVRVRGLDPPADIRHRALRWDETEKAWVPRDFLVPAKRRRAKQPVSKYAGATGASRRLGRALALRTLSRPEYVKLRALYRHQGPYLPVMLQACGEQESAYEHREGATPYGAFTFSLAAELGNSPGGKITFEALVKRATARIAEVGYSQHPELVGPDLRTKRSVVTPPPKPRVRRKAKSKSKQAAASKPRGGAGARR